MARLFEAIEIFGEMTPILELENKDGCASHYKFDDDHEKKIRYRRQRRKPRRISVTVGWTIIMHINKNKQIKIHHQNKYLQNMIKRKAQKVLYRNLFGLQIYVS